MTEDRSNLPSPVPEPAGESALPAAIATYEQEIAFFGKTATGRPDTVKRRLDHLAQCVVQEYAKHGAGSGLALTNPAAPDLDDRGDLSVGTDKSPGEFKPTKNRGFLNAHKANVTAFKTAMRHADKVRAANAKAAKK